jgi:hypothetical protein
MLAVSSHCTIFPTGAKRQSEIKKKFDSFITNTEDSHKQSSLFSCGLCADADCIALIEQIIVAITL